MLIKLQPSHNFSSPSESEGEEEGRLEPRTKKGKIQTFSRKRKGHSVGASGEPSGKNLKVSSPSVDTSISTESSPMSTDSEGEDVSEPHSSPAEASLPEEIVSASAEGLVADTLANLAHIPSDSPRTNSPTQIPSSPSSIPPAAVPTTEKKEEEVVHKEATASAPSTGTLGTDMVDQFPASPIMDSVFPAAAPLRDTLPAISSHLSSMNTFIQQLSTEKPSVEPTSKPDDAASGEPPKNSSPSKSMEKNIQKLKSDMKKLFSNVNTLQNKVNDMIERFTQHQFWFNTFVLPAIAPQDPPIPFTQFQPPQNLLQPSTSSSSDRSSPSK